MSINNKRDKANMTMDERREQPRYNCFQSTFYSTMDGVYEGVIRDRDEGAVKGVYFTANENLLVGQVVTIAIPAFGEQKERKLKGVIVRKEPGRFGVHFKSHLNE
jgi:hypothetical protein